ncbi:TAT-binding protein-like protein 7, AAA ATPase [Coemansia guatemalensis]|uniref:TAT-binding protein-like protein 7, AAA ATPase n=1 Tax=Coemansia guatemalensis TaxID=2761395 RepID=A0A9W8I1K3_9FUNG|nr:TAT-binding protein-like protein 7, AAA ATPase [Coemansia guatemalensis]
MASQKAKPVASPSTRTTARRRSAIVAASEIAAAAKRKLDFNFGERVVKKKRARAPVDNNRKKVTVKRETEENLPSLENASSSSASESSPGSGSSESESGSESSDGGSDASEEEQSHSAALRSLKTEDMQHTPVGSPNTRLAAHRTPNKQQATPKSRTSRGSSNKDDSAAQYNLRQRAKEVSYRQLAPPRSPPTRYMQYMKEMRALERQAAEATALRELEEVLDDSSVGNRLGDKAEKAGQGERREGGGAGETQQGESNHEEEAILPLNLAELGEERCRRAGYMGPIGTPSEATRVTFDDVGGLDEHVQALREMVVLPLAQPQVLQALGVRAPRGVLFHGAPGTGKTLVARALAHSCAAQGSGAPAIAFFMRRGGDCLSKWVGEAERQLRRLFAQARAFQPSIIFFDELDGLAPERSGRHDHVHASVVATLLALMDGVDDRGHVIVVAATNRPDAIDPALRRPGRLDRELLFRAPGPEARRRILRIHTRRWPLPPALEQTVVDRTPGWGGADIAALCAEAALAAVRRSCPDLYAPQPECPAPAPTRHVAVTMADITHALAAVAPAAARATAAPTAPLPPELHALAGRHVARGARLLASQLQPSARVFRPRVAVYGLAGMAVGAVAAAIAHAVGGDGDATVFAVGPATDAATIPRVFAEAQRRQPSVVLIADVAALPDALGAAGVALLSHSIRALPAAARVAVVAASEAPPCAAAAAADLDRLSLAARVWRAAVPPFARPWFAAMPSACRICVALPTAPQRQAFFAPLVAAVDAPPVAADASADAQLASAHVVVRPSDSAAPSDAPSAASTAVGTPSASDIAALQPATSQRSPSQLRSALCDIAQALASNRLFRRVARAPSPSRNRAFYAMARRSLMFLDGVQLKAAAGQYTSARSFLDDIEIVAYSARLLARANRSSTLPSDAEDASGSENDSAAGNDCSELQRRAALLESVAASLVERRLGPLALRSSPAPSDGPAFEMPAAGSSSPAPAAVAPEFPSAPAASEPPPTPAASEPPFASNKPMTARPSSAQRWSASGSFNNLSTASRPRPTTSMPVTPAHQQSGIPQVVRKTSASASKKRNPSDARKVFLADLLRLTRGFSIDALESLRVSLADILTRRIGSTTCSSDDDGACTSAIFNRLSRALRIWNEDALRDREELGLLLPLDADDDFEEYQC